MDRYYSEFDGPICKKYRKRLIPFALRFYKELTQQEVDFLKINLDQLKPHYGSKIIK
jgi:hypothetical protein